MRCNALEGNLTEKQLNKGEIAEFSKSIHLRRREAIVNLCLFDHQTRYFQGKKVPLMHGVSPYPPLWTHRGGVGEVEKSWTHSTPLIRQDFASS